MLSWFKGTPVSITQSRDGSISIEVPREFCFDPGSSAVKPPLAAVLNKTAESLRRVSAAQLELLAAPMDTGGTNNLALQRADQIRRHMRRQGVPAARMGKPSAAGADAVQLRIQLTSP